MQPKVLVKKEMYNIPDCWLPKVQHDLDVGYDLYVATRQKLPPLETVYVPTGIAVEMPDDLFLDIRPRSSTSKLGLVIANSPGTVEPNYRGQLVLIVHNMRSYTQVLHRGDRIAQMVFHRAIRPVFAWVDELSPSDRGAGGFGSTGK